MTAPTDTAAAPGTSVAKATDRDSALTREGKLHMAQIRATRALTVAITNEAWGNALSPEMRYAVAEYMRRNRLDVNEVDILGGKIYRNGNYYKRRVAEMRTKGLIEWTDGEHIGPDAQLDAALTSADQEVAEWARAENFRRVRERIRWAVPADATHAYVVRIKLTTEKNPVEGADWITPLRKNNRGNIADPIGGAEPEKTVITRAWRRAGLLAAAEIPELRGEEAALDAQAEVVETRVQQIGETEVAREVRQATPSRAIAAGDEPYSDTMRTSTAPREAETVDASTHKPDPAVLQQALSIEDPYGQSSPVAPPAVDALGTTAPTRSKWELFPLPFGTDDLKGKPIGDLAADDLTAAYRWAKKGEKYPEFIAAVDELLEERRFADEDKTV